MDHSIVSVFGFEGTFLHVNLNEKQNLLKTYKSNLKRRTNARLFCFYVFIFRKLCYTEKGYSN